jgi:hypothetical protein
MKDRRTSSSFAPVAFSFALAQRREALSFPGAAPLMPAFPNMSAHRDVPVVERSPIPHIGMHSLIQRAVEKFLRTPVGQGRSPLQRGVELIPALAIVPLSPA